MNPDVLPDLQQPYRQFVTDYLKLLLARAQRAHRHLDTADRRSIHTFRVAVRRLHTWLSIPGLLPVTDKKLLRRLKHHIKATNALRDAAIHNKWLKKHGYSQRIALKPPSLPHRWNRLCRRLETSIETAAQIHEDRLNEPFSCRGASVVQALFDEFATALLTIHGAEDIRGIHHSRILAKRLRYMLEPFAASDKQAEQLMQEMVSFQDYTGMLHDLATMRDALAPPPSLRAHIEREMKSLYQIVKTRHIRTREQLIRDFREWLENCDIPPPDWV